MSDSGKDIVHAGAINPGKGSERVLAGLGPDTVWSRDGKGADFINGGAGNDTCMTSTPDNSTSCH